MAIHQTKHQTDLEKRLLLLRSQVYGKQEFRVQSSEFRVKDKLAINSSSDLSYLHHDLLKILIFASAAIGAQGILFFVLKNNLLKINFF